RPCLGPLLTALLDAGRSRPLAREFKHAGELFEGFAAHLVIETAEQRGRCSACNFGMGALWIGAGRIDALCLQRNRTARTAFGEGHNACVSAAGLTHQ